MTPEEHAASVVLEHRDELLAEIAKLKAALTEIAEHTDVNADECPVIARKALDVPS